MMIESDQEFQWLPEVFLDISSDREMEEYKLREVARLAVLAYNTQEIATVMNLGLWEVKALIKKVDKTQLVEKLQQARDDIVVQFERKAKRISDESLSIILVKLGLIKEEYAKSKNVSEESMKLAMKALETVNTMIGKPKKEGNSMSIIFTPDMLRRAQQASNIVYDIAEVTPIVDTR